jgi:hypothetical protein
MFRSVPSRIFAILCCAAAISHAGCGGSTGATVKGKVVLPAGVELLEDDSLYLGLSSTETGGTSTGGKIDPKALTFAIDGPGGKGLPAGKYKVTVTFTPYAGRPESAKRKETIDKLLAPFSGDKSQLTIDLPASGQQEITVDLEKKTVSK